MRDQVVETKRVTRPNRVSTDGIYLAYVSEIMLFRVRTQMKRMLNTSLKPVYWPNSIAGNLSFNKSIKLYFFRLNYIIENKLLLSQFFSLFCTVLFSCRTNVHANTCVVCHPPIVWYATSCTLKACYLYFSANSSEVLCHSQLHFYLTTLIVFIMESNVAVIPPSFLLTSYFLEVFSTSWLNLNWQVKYISRFASSFYTYNSQ